MKPLFTIHEGEFLVGDHISRSFGKRYDVWVPAKDDGIDLLVTHKKKKKHSNPVSIQVKHSRSFDARHSLPDEYAGSAKGWYTLNPTKIRKSRADIWIFVILTLRQEKHFIIMPTAVLKSRIPKRQSKSWHFYLSTWDNGYCFNTRGMTREELLNALKNGKIDPKKDYTEYLENWDLLEKVARS